MAISSSVSRNEQDENSDIDTAYEGEPNIFTHHKTDERRFMSDRSIFRRGRDTERKLV